MTRPCTYEEVGRPLLAEIAKWAKAGCVYQQMSDKLGISHSTFLLWRQRYPELQAAIDDARRLATEQVEGALLNRALGYTKIVKKPMKLQRQQVDEQGHKVREDIVEYVEDEVHIPPDVTAIKFWLTNRAADEWKNVRDEEIDNRPLEVRIRGGVELAE